jgi:hypothetical protein
MNTEKKTGIKWWKTQETDKEGIKERQKKYRSTLHEERYSWMKHNYLTFSRKLLLRFNNTTIMSRKQPSHSFHIYTGFQTQTNNWRHKTRQLHMSKQFTCRTM